MDKLMNNEHQILGMLPNNGCNCDRKILTPINLLKIKDDIAFGP